MKCALILIALVLIEGIGSSRALADPPARTPEDPYEHYINTSKDFQPVKQTPAMLLKAFPSWTYMPWTFKWTIGYTPDSGKWSIDHGYNGALIDWGNISSSDSKTGKLDWINQFHLRFYMDHTAGKHDLHLWDGGENKAHLKEVHGTGIRVHPLNDALAKKLQTIIRQNIGNVKSSPFRAAYALDDEISWGTFVHPCMWQATDDKAAYQSWLREIYGPGAPHRDGWISYSDIQPKLKTWDIAGFDASQLMDQWTFNDACFNNFVGDLVTYANSIDPETPCGFVGGQSPSAFGGYDYARIMRKVQFIEAYNIGSSQAIIRSFNPGNCIPTVTTHFHQNVDDDAWQTWYYLAHGNRGFIGWVDEWFDGKTPKTWHDQLGPQYKEAAEKIGPLMSGTHWIHDGVAIYYSHPSIQLGWILDADAHGHTWINRNGDDRLGASHRVRLAWEEMLRDSGIQYNFISYADVIQHGIPRDYKVLILPACLCLSDAEARQIHSFCDAGGTVIADYMPGLWDQHGKGRAGGGALDDLFGVHHDPHMKSRDVFAGKLWCEVDQDAHFSWKTSEEFLSNNNCIKDASGFNKAVRDRDVMHVNHVGKGAAILMNLSPQWYNAYREAGFDASQKRKTFIAPINNAGVNRWVDLKAADEKTFGYEITYWSINGRTTVFVCQNPRTTVSATGGGNSSGLKTQTIPITLTFAHAIKNVRDEHSGKGLPDGTEFNFDWTMTHAVIISFEGAPQR